MYNVYIHRERRSTFISNSIPLRLWIIIDSSAAIGYLSLGLDSSERVDEKRDGNLLLRGELDIKEELEKIESSVLYAYNLSRIYWFLINLLLCEQAISIRSDNQYLRFPYYLYDLKLLRKLCANIPSF